MTDPDLDLIQKINSAIGEGDPASMSENVHPDVVWEHNIGIGTLEEGVYRGRENVLRLLERIVETWEYIRAVPRSIDQREDGSYHIRGELHAKHRTSDAEIIASYEQQLEVRDGKLVRGSMTTGEVSLP